MVKYTEAQCVASDVLARYHEESLAQMRFFDDNTRSWWTPITGGGNVPALNDLLAPHGIALGDAILTGVLDMGKFSVQVGEGRPCSRGSYSAN
jgi:hypothetical protein